MLNKNMIHPENAFTLLCLFLKNPRANMMGEMMAMMAKLKQLSLLHILSGVRSVWSNCEDSKPIK